MPSAFVLLSALWVSFCNTDTCVNFYRRVATLAKEKNRARDARLKTAKEATNNRSNNHTFKSDPSLDKNGRKTQKRSKRKSVALSEDDNGIDVEQNGEEDDPTQMRMRARMEAAMHDAEDEGTEEPEGPSDADVDAEGLDGDFAFGDDDSITYEDDHEDGESEGISVNDEEMKDPEDEDDNEYRSSIGPVGKRKEEERPLSPQYGMTSSTVGYLPDQLFAQAAAAITARVPKPTDSKTKEVERRKRSRRKVKSKDLIIGQVIRNGCPENHSLYFDIARGRYKSSTL